MQKSFFQLPRCVYIQMASLLSKNHAVASRDLYSPHQWRRQFTDILLFDSTTKQLHVMNVFTDKP